jgi:hypothetical protein
MTLPFRAMRPEAPFSRPAVICSCITVLIRFRRSREKPACSGAAVGKLAPPTNDAPKQKTSRIRMSANLSQTQAARVRPSYKAVGCGTQRFSFVNGVTEDEKRDPCARICSKAVSTVTRRQKRSNNIESTCEPRNSLSRFCLE